MEFKKVSELLSNNAQNYPDKQYIFFKDKVYTYKEAEENVRHVANVLKAHGVKQGDRVQVLLDNSPEFVFSYFGVQKLGAIFVPTNVFFKDTEVAALMNDCTAEYLITSEKFADRMANIPELAADLKTVFAYTDTSFKSVNIEKEPRNTADTETAVKMDDVATILYTSGTTGRPKGVMLTQFNILSNARQTKQGVEIEHDDRMLLVLPMFHATSFMCSCLAPHVAGASIVILESIMEMGKEYYPKMLAELRPTILIAVPALYGTMARAKPAPELKQLPIKRFVSGGAPLPVEIINRFKELYGQPVIEGYGLSESSPAAVFNPLDVQKPGTIGLPLPDVKVRIVDENDNDVPLGQRGELLLQGPNVMKGYWNQPEETEKALRNGWLHTGDVATMDEDGFISIVDRIKDLILVKGMNLYPREVEELFYKYPGVLGAALVGIPESDGSSEIPIAYVKLDPAANVDVEELKLYIKHNVAAFKVPRKYVFTDDIPMNAGGKILKTALRERALKEFGK